MAFLVTGGMTSVAVQAGRAQYLFATSLTALSTHQNRLASLFGVYKSLATEA